MLKRFLNHIKEEKFFEQDKSILLALSGGIDSMCLFHLMLNSKIRFSVAHFDHNTRDGESLKDAEFVQSICEKYNVKFHLSSIDDNFSLNNFQAEARRQRYDFFKSLQYDIIVTAHHNDDDTETILMNFLQGKSIKGINAKSLMIIRPLLIFKKKEIEDFVTSEAIEYRQDESNFKNTYLRNRVRNEIAPILLSNYPEYESRIKGLSTRITRQANLLEQLVSQIIGPIFSKDQILIKKKNLKHNDIKSEELLEVYLKQYNFNYTQAKDIASSFNSVGAVFQSQTYELVVDREHLILRLIEPEQVQVIIIDSFDDFPLELKYGTNSIKFSLEDKLEYNNSKNKFQCGIAKIKFPLVLRNWESGDKFQPLGMEGKTKSLKKLFADMKINRFDKQSIPILCNGDGKIMWVCNIRQDERFKLAIEDSSCLTITCSSFDD